MTAREDLEGATRRLQELAERIEQAADRPAWEIEELTRQASDLSAAVVEMIPRAIAEAEDEARGDSPAGVASPSVAVQSPEPEEPRGPAGDAEPGPA